MEEARPVLRAKMRVVEVTQAIGENGKPEHERVKLAAVYGTGDTENAKWSTWTPNASFEIFINNKEAFGQLSRGHEFYVDFTPALVANTDTQSATAAA